MHCDEEFYAFSLREHPWFFPGALDAERPMLSGGGSSTADL
jgi:hypothetical protein